jgi:mono/diheme cytochrome c family protein
MMKMKHLLPLICLSLLATSCKKEDMGSQPKDKVYQESQFFADGTSARPFVMGTVARGSIHDDIQLYHGFDLDNTHYVDHFPDHYPTEADGPFPVKGVALKRVLDRGKEQFTIFCSMCHGDAGDGRGIIVERGFVPPPSYHIDRLRTAPVGHFFDVISVGYGAMYAYGDRIAPADRWAIVAYIRTLQMSQGSKLAELDPALQKAAKQVEAQ